MGLGKMRYRVTVERSTDVSDGVGGVLPTWHDLLDCWADIVLVASGDSLRDTYKQYDWLYSMRVRTEVASKVERGDRVLWRGHYYVILAVDGDINYMTLTIGR